MIFLKLLLFMLSGILVTYGIVIQVRGIMEKALIKKDETLSSPESQTFSKPIPQKNEILGQNSGEGEIVGNNFSIKKVVKNNKISIGISAKLIGIVILGYLIFTYKTQDLIIGLVVFFLSALVIISWILLARRVSIR